MMLALPFYGHDEPPSGVLGVDPGLHGALALFDPLTDDLDLYDMPATADGLVDVYELGRWVDARSHRIGRAVLERVGQMPGSGHAFSFGRNYGDVRGVLGANFIPMSVVTPAKWKRAMGVTKDKASSLAKACELFPLHANKFARKKDADRAEAALIAKWATATA